MKWSASSFCTSGTVRTAFSILRQLTQEWPGKLTASGLCCALVEVDGRARLERHRLLVVVEPQHAEEVERREQEGARPEHQEELARQQMPLQHEVDGREELERRRELDETERDLQRVGPLARL